MAYYRDLRDYLEILDKTGKLVRIKRPINKDTQLSPLVRLQYRGLREEQRKGFLFENVTDSHGRKYDIPVAIGILAGSDAIYATGLKCSVEEISQKFAFAESNPIAPREVANGPVQEELHYGKQLLEHGGLGEFPIPVATPGFDPSPYLTAPYWVTRDPESGIYNLGMYRAMVKAPDRAGLNFSGPEKGAAVHLRKCRKLGIKMPAAIVIGGAPNLGYVSVSAIPRDVDEFGVAGAIAGEPVELVKCKTIDLNVPAYAEVVIEGIVDPELVEPEAPFGESYGFVGPMDMNPFIQITAITHRKQPIWLATLSQYPPSESTKMRQLGNQGTVLRHLRQSLKMDWVLDIALFEEASSGRVMAIKLKGATSARAQATLDAAAKRAPYTKIIIVVDEDVNVHDLGSVLLAVAMRTQPHRDYRIDSYPAISLSDYSLEPLDSLAAHQSGTQQGRPNASRLLIDATMKWPYPPTSLPKKQYMDEAIRIWREEGLPTLDIKPPLFGVNLGYWTEEHERHAQAAILGESYQAGLDYEKKRRRELNQV